MIEFTSFQKLMPRQLKRVSLKPYDSEGVIPLFADRTEDLTLALREQLNRYNRRNNLPIPETYEEKKEVLKWYLEQTAIVGALAASRAKRNSHVYDLGGASGIASIVYALISGQQITLVDQEKTETDQAREIAKMMKVDGLIEVVNGKAEDVITERGLGPQDIAIFSQPDGTLDDYLQSVLKEYSTSLILNIGLHLQDMFGRSLVTSLENELIVSFANEYLAPQRYVVQICRSNFSSSQLVFLCTKAK